jgi:hypothetical protein
VRDLAFIVLVGLTSLAGYLLGTRRLGLSPPGLAGAARATLEAIGMAAGFLLANLGLAALGVALGRTVTGGFVSAYAVDDRTLAAASLLQGFLFRWWWGRR